MSLYDRLAGRADAPAVSLPSSSPLTWPAAGLDVGTDLRGAQVALLHWLQQGGITTPPVLDLVVALDVSASFEDEHRAGVTNDLLVRLVPWGLTFDRNRSLELITFSSGAASAHLVGSLTAENCRGFVSREVVARVPGWCGATDYSHPIERALRHGGWLAADATEDGAARPGLFGRLFGGRPSAAAAAAAEADGARAGLRRPLLVLFITDGDNQDKIRARAVLRASQQRRDAVYFLFLGISNQGSRFPFLEAIGAEFDNTGFVAVDDLRAFVRLSHEALNERLIGPELLRWLRQPG